MDEILVVLNWLKDNASQIEELIKLVEDTINGKKA